MACQTLAVHRQTGGVGYFMLSSGHESHDVLVEEMNDTFSPRVSLKVTVITVSDAWQRF